MDRNMESYASLPQSTEQTNLRSSYRPGGGGDIYKSKGSMTVYQSLACFMLTITCILSCVSIGISIYVYMILNEGISSNQIKEGAISSDLLADGSVLSVHVGGKQIRSSHLADTLITTEKLAPFAVTTEKLASASISSDKIKDKAVMADDINDQQIRTNHLTSVLTLDRPILKTLGKGEFAVESVEDYTTLYPLQNELLDIGRETLKLYRIYTKYTFLETSFQSLTSNPGQEAEFGSLKQANERVSKILMNHDQESLRLNFDIKKLKEVYPDSVIENSKTMKTTTTEFKDESEIQNENEPQLYFDQSVLIKDLVASYQYLSNRIEQLEKEMEEIKKTR